MPLINKLPKKEKSNTRTENTESRLLRKKLYGTKKWRDCRLSHLVREPLCQQCLKEGKVNAGSVDSPLQVHHKRSPFINGSINYELAFDDKNLETICSYHHGIEHSGAPSAEDIIKNLDELLK